MITSNKRTLQSPPISSPVGQGPGVVTPLSGNTTKKKAKKDSKKVGSHQRKLSDNRIYYHHNNIVIAANGNINGPAISLANGNLILQNANNYSINNNTPNNNLVNNNFIVSNSQTNANNNQNTNLINHTNPNIQSNQVIINSSNTNQLNLPSGHFNSNEHFMSNNSPSSHQPEEESGTSEINLDIKNKLLNLLTQKNDSKKLIASKSSGNSLDFAIGEFGKRKKSPQNLINNNYNIGGMASSHHYHIGKKSPSKIKNLLYFQEKTTNKSQLQNNSSTHFVLSPKEPKNIQQIFNQLKPTSKKDQYLQLQQQQSFSPILSTVMKSKGLSPEKKDSLSPSKENLKNIIAAQKYVNSGYSPSRGGQTCINNSGNLHQADSKTALKKKMSVPKPYEITSYLSKRNSSKERIINLFNSKQEALTDHNTRKSSALSKKPKSVSPENQQQMQKNIKKAISNTIQYPQMQQQMHQFEITQKQKPFFKKNRPPELEELHSTNTISQSVPNSSKHNIQNTYNTPNNQNLNNPHTNLSSQYNETKKFYFDHNLTPSSQLINSQTIHHPHHQNPIQSLNLNFIQNSNNQTNSNFANLSSNNTNAPPSSLSNNNINNPNNISYNVNYSHSARSNNQISQQPQSTTTNPLFQNYLNPFINSNAHLQNKIITAAINYNLKNAENRLMKIQEDIYEGGEQSNNSAMNEQLQKTFLRTSKLLSGYKARELKWEQEKRALVDEIKFLKNLLYTEQFDDLVINSQMNCFLYNFACFALVICALCA